MKKLTILIFAAAALAACTPKGGIQASRQVKPDFSATFIVPLTTGRSNGEAEIMDAQLAAAVNVEILKPAILQLVQDAYNGKLATHPDYPEAPAYDPTSHFRDRVDKISGGNPDFSMACISLQVGYNGHIQPDANKMKVSHLDFIWVDASQASPELLISRVQAKDLEKYEVVRHGRTCNLREFLDNGMYERYPVRVEALADTFGIKTHQQAFAIKRELQYGDVDALKCPYPRNY